MGPDTPQGYKNRTARDVQPSSRLDRWSAESDALAEVLTEQEGRLRGVRRTERFVGLALTVFAALGIAVSRDRAFAWGGFFAALLVVAVYLPLRVRPRQKALAEIRARLAILDLRCPSCGYALRHLLSERCPECGRRVELPSRELVERVLGGGKVTVAQGNIASDLGWIVLFIMLLTATLMGRLFSLEMGVASMGAPPLAFLLISVLRKHRQSGRIPPYAICDACGKRTLLEENACAPCGAALLAEHVYVRPGLRGDSDPRLQRLWAQLVGGVCACATLPVLALCILDPGSRGSMAMVPTLVEVVLGIIGFVILGIDLHVRAKPRLEKFDRAAFPLCHHCLGSLRRSPANGVCPHCQRSYRALELAGGR